MAKEFKVLSPTAILGYGFPEKSFFRGLEQRPDCIAVDAGSTDPGPYYLGAGKSFTDRTFVKRDLTIMLKASCDYRIPLLIGSAGGAGAKPHVDWCLAIIDEIARQNSLSFKMGVVYTDIKKSLVKTALACGELQPLKFVDELKLPELEETSQIVAQVGLDPVTAALAEGCQVVVMGRCYDPSVFAALPVCQGANLALALHMGKILECAAIAATPGSGSDSVLGILHDDSFILQPLSSERCFTKQSTAAHSLYEKSDPYRLPGPGGTILLNNCSFKDFADGCVEVSGSEFEPSDPRLVKLEGARPVGHRSISIAGIRDPILIENIDSVLAAVRTQVQSLHGKSCSEIHFHVYGKNGVMGARELQQAAGFELCLLIEVLAATAEEAASLCSITRSSLLHYGYPDRISTAGNLAFPFSPSDFSIGECYQFSLYHLLRLPEKHNFPVNIRQYNQGVLK